MIALRTKEPFTRTGLLRRGAPFVTLLVLGFALFAVGSPRHWIYFGVALAVGVAACTAAALVPWQRLPILVATTPPLATVASIALLRQGQGGSISGYGALFLVPTLWVAWYGTRAQLVVVLAAVLTAFWLPIVAIGAPDYPASQWRGGGLLVLIVAFFGLVIQQLITNLLDEEERRVSAEQRLRQASAYEIHDDVVQNLTVAQLALATSDSARAKDAVEEALRQAQHVVDLLLSARPATEPGSLVRQPPEKLDRLT